MFRDSQEQIIHSPTNVVSFKLRGGYGATTFSGSVQSPVIVSSGRAGASPSQSGSMGLATVTVPVLQQQPLTGRVTGPVKVLSQICSIWALTDDDVRILLDYEDRQTVRDLLAGVVSLKGRDREDRVRHMFLIHEALNQLFRSPNEERDWLREPLAELRGKSPISMMLDGSMDALLIVRHLVERLSGR
jgi:uncharacterized protein (DUF2384 family)